MMWVRMTEVKRCAIWASLGWCGMWWVLSWADRDMRARDDGVAVKVNARELCRAASLTSWEFRLSIF